MLRSLPGLALIFLVWGIAETLAYGLRLPVPGSVLGMMLLAAVLHTRLVPCDLVEPAASGLIRYMALFFVPPGVAVILYLDLLRDAWLAITAGAVVGTITVLVAVGVMTQRLEPDE